MPCDTTEHNLNLAHPGSSRGCHKPYACLITFLYTMGLFIYLVGIILTLIFRFIQFGWFQTTSKRSPTSSRMIITLKWGRERLILRCFGGAYIAYIARFYHKPSSETTTLGELRRFASEQTHLPIDSFKLIFSGGIMKDDKALRK